MGGFDSCPGHRVYPWERYLSSISPPSARGVKQGCRLCTHAFKIMHGRKRTWMAKRKSRGPETYRYGRHINPTKAGEAGCTLDTSDCWSLSVCSVGTQRVNGLTRNPNMGNKIKGHARASGCRPAM